VAVVGLSYGFDEDWTRKTSVHLFSRKNGKWTEDQVLKSAVRGDVGDSFGEDGAIAIDGDTIVIGDEIDNDDAAGAAYVYVLKDGNWTMQAKLTGTPDDDHYGRVVRIRGDRVAVGTWTDGPERVDVFKRNGENWELEARLTAPTFNDPNLSVRDVGSSFAFDDASNRIVVLFTVQDSDQDISTTYGVVFQNDGGTWTQQGQHFSPPQPYNRVYSTSTYSLMSQGTVVLDLSWYDNASSIFYELHGKVSTLELNQSQNQWMWTGDVVSDIKSVNDMAMEGRRIALYSDSEWGESNDIYTRALDKTWELSESLPMTRVPVAVSGNRIAATLADAFSPSACVYSRPLRRGLL
jgi:hypothetical protein